MDLETLCKVKLARNIKTNTVLSHLYVQYKIFKLKQAESWMLVARNWANGEEMVKEYKVSVKQENTSRCPLCNMPIANFIIYLKFAKSVGL